MLSGVPVPAKNALDQGILDSISTGDLVEDAISFLHKKLDETTEHPKVRDLNEKLVEARGNENVMAEAKALASKSRKGQFAPGQIIKCVEAAIEEDDFDAGMKKESDLFLECLLHPQREAMIHIFFGERTAGKILDVPKDTETQKIGSACRSYFLGFCIFRNIQYFSSCSFTKEYMDHCFSLRMKQTL